MASVWPDTFVEESNLKVQVAALRRALGDGNGGKRFLVTVPGRGYTFVEPVTELRLPHVMLPVSSFVAEALNRAPEVPEVACVSVTETAAEKLVSLTRRTAMDLAGLSRDFDPALVRHVYDLHVLRDHVDRGTVIELAREIAQTDADEYRNQYPAYHADISGKTRKALDALRTDPVHQRRFNDFVSAMVYGERVKFDKAMATVAQLSNHYFET
jgi:Nucleotidyl transferase AbiEii toxin, Type IV TA system/Transcriptional regulatory protein, C terminal